MEKGDLITLIGGVILVFAIALVLNPHYLSGFPLMGGKQPVTPVTTTVSTVRDTPGLTLTPVPPLTAAVTRTPTAEPTIAPPYRLFYNSSPFSYPRFKMPDNVDLFGAGDIPFRGREMVTFAFINESRGGLTQRFNVPYPVWTLNATVTAERTPQYGNFRMVLCYANNGTVIDGMEILNRGSMIRVIQTSGVDVYMIITTAYIDSDQIDLETPKDYYLQYRDR
ncbi:MAG TPA: hypothetical protein VHN82_03415 [Methanoregula sp.]|nr:hypothetical protein [Methanoregula sp.]